ncbi:MAG: fibronectin type III domain-containing protein [Flavobacterium nitrogenifigens]|uniref:fibronectin type III domain-containing protein n=1 Tax=Flavobacterium nitrogenifigens TaxID=1617283 RepID=UPI0028099087|nr:fibronectin type III domain-containing protein [Flavobacterium nitrogenifigens]MDQ8013088.1 fibronectin type III domain-containing protein [Flavobacterium nitrogenifigens]
MLKKLQFQLFLTLGFWLSAIVSGIAQTYPVTISTQITQPSPIYLSNYADATTINSPIKVQIALNDLTISNRQIRLKCYFQGQSISLMTNDFVVGARNLFLEGGVPLQLTNVDLAPYFEYQNLVGINPNQYAQALPEGIYNFSVEVYDFATNKKLSKKTSVTTIIFQNDPPFLNLPLNNASIMQQNIQNIIFSWTPRQINVSNVEYEFSLVEIWDKYTPVQNAFLYSPPLYTTTTRSTTLQYGVSEPQLLPGKKYAWRVKAKALLGAEEIGVFKNNGYSEIFAFDYETYCTAPLAITTTDISQDQAKITWSGDIDNFDYQVNYREKNANSDWYKIVTPREFATISNLKPNATYEYTVGASCEVGKYTHSTVHEFSTMAKDEIAFVGCGIKPDPADLANKNPLPELFANDVVKAGDFPIVVLHSTGSNGKFSGDGYVTLPFLEKFRTLIDAANAAGGPDIGKYSRIRITFDNIGINTDFKLISGEIIASYDPNWGSMIDGDKLVDDITNLVEEYDPIMESIFGPKPKPEEINKEDEEDITESNNPTPTDTKTESSEVVIVEVDEPTPTSPPIENEIAPEKNDIKEEATSAPSNGAVTENGYYIEYNGQKYYNGGKIKIPYSRNMFATFEMKTLPNDAKVTYTMHEPGKQEARLPYDSTTSKSNLPIENSALKNNLRIFDLQAEATNVDGTPKVRVEIEKVVTKFTLNKLTATDVKTPARSASAPYTLYYINKPGKVKNTKIEAVISQNDLKKIPLENLTWKINDIEDPYKAGTTNFSLQLVRTDKTEEVKFTNIAGYPNLATKEVKIKWIDENRKTSKFVLGTSSSPFLEKALKLTEFGKEIGKRLEKIPFIEKINKNEHIESGIGFYYDIIPFDQTIVNVEDPDSRLYYTEKTIAGGLELGLEGTSKFTIWGIPYDKIPYVPEWVKEKAKKIVKAEVFAVAKSKAGGDMKMEYVQKKLAEQNAWKDVSKKVNPAKVALNVEFGVGAEIKLLEDSELFSVGGDANGMAKAELASYGWYDNDFKSKILQEGVWIDFVASMYIRVAGVKYETAPWAKKIQIIEPKQ